MSNQKKQSFLGGAAILAAAVVVVKFIGFFYKVPLNNILGGPGKTYFDTAYKIYNFLLTFSTAGLPLAISKLTSQAHAQGRENEKRKIFRTAIVLFFVLGTVGALFMFFQAEGLAGFLENSLAAQPIRALAPAVFCVCLLACMRGYTQGQGNMTPTAVSQVLEALLKLAIGLPLAWYVLRIGMSLEMGAAAAILGVTAGTAVSMLFLVGYLTKHRNRTQSLDVPSGSSHLIRQILAIGIPITLSNSAMSILNIIDTKIVMGQLQNALLLSEESAAALNGQYSMAMDMPNMVASFVYPVTMSLIPFAAAALARQDHAGADRIISSAFRIIAILALPALNPVLLRFLVACANAAFCRLFDGDAVAMGLVFGATLAGFYLRQKLLHWGMDVKITFFCCAFAASLLASPGLIFGWGATPQTAMAASVLFLIPGIPLINAMMDILDGHVLMAVSRLVQASTLIVCIALGLALTMLLLGVDSL